MSRLRSRKKANFAKLKAKVFAKAKSSFIVSVMVALLLHVMLFLFSFNHISQSKKIEFQPVMISLSFRENHNISPHKKTDKANNILNHNDKNQKKDFAQKRGEGGKNGPSNAVNNQSFVGEKTEYSEEYSEFFGAYLPVLPNPQTIKFQAPSYPKSAILNGQQGTVKLKLLVDDQGKPVSTNILDSSGYIALDRAALNASQAWIFTPARKGQLTIPSWVIVEHRFELR